MSKRLKQLLAIVFMAVLCLHFGLVFLFAAPLKLKNEKVTYLSSFYCYPYFQQSWGLFVPAPDAQHQLLVRYKKQNQWTSWTDILQAEYLKHRTNRLSGGETVVLLLSNSTHYALNVLPEKQTLHKQMHDKKELQVLRYEIEQYLKIYEKLASKTDFEIIIINKTPNKTQANYFKFLKID
jgi:hypothetical protein